MSSPPSASGAPDIDIVLVTHLIRAQFPQWAGLTIKPVALGGWDNQDQRDQDQRGSYLDS